MADRISIYIDKKEYFTTEDKTILEAAQENGVYIPTLCHLPETESSTSCRICTVMVNGRPLTACSTPVGEGMEIDNNTTQITEWRKSVLEIMFTEGNHFCPSCEKSGNCRLQALAYRYQIMAPQFPYQFNEREIDATNDKIIQDHNRCIICKRCVRAIKDEHGRSFFAFIDRGHKLRVRLDRKLGKELTDELAEAAMEVCPVGSILVREKGFETPIGQRKYDLERIGADIEQNGQMKNHE
jgi:[NiFe] hydrogenase diaphorase moiety small subunit